MASKFQDLFDNVTLSGERTDEILRKAKNMKNKEQRSTLGTKSIYVTLGATAAAILLTVFGGAWLLNSGLLQREPYYGGGYGQEEEIIKVNQAAASARNQMTEFLQEELLRGEGRPADMAGVLVIARSADGDMVFTGWDNYGGTGNIESSNITDEDTAELKLMTIINNLFEKNENLQAFNNQDCTLVFIIANNICTHAAFIPNVWYTEARHLAVTQDNGEIVFSAIMGGRLVADINPLLKTGQIIGTSPAQNYPVLDLPGERIYPPPGSLEHIPVISGDLLVMNLSNTEPNGLTFTINNFTDSENEYKYGSDYVLYVQRQGEWVLLYTIIEDSPFNDEGYTALSQSETEPAAVNWSWLYGELEPGVYKFSKGIICWRSPGDFDSYRIESEFTISYTYTTGISPDYPMLSDIIN
ncbi:MAG: hypothetical protein LBC82_02510 [Oscillospiraceae bacterium]|jgi:hypothetical protein|nr:hypothetical protein [Oscillospiraceae bacterium]